MSTTDESFTAFVTASSDSLGRLAWLLTGDSDAAAELLQASLVKLYRAWPRIDQTAAFGYVRRIMANEKVSAWRLRRDVPVAVPVLPPTPDAADALAERETLARLLRTLPARQRAVLALRYYEDLTESETAEALGIPLGSVKSAAHRGMAALRSAYLEGVRS